MNFQPLEKNIFELQHAMEEGAISAVQLVDFYLGRIEAYDKQGPRINSIVTINSGARAEAEALDAERKLTGKRSALHGIPILVKDNIDTFDMPTTASSVLLAENRPTRDAFIVKKLREAGAIILAKTNLSEFACHGFTDGTLLGQTLNPYDLTRTPGGSSGGTGSAVAANFGTAGLGTDTVNSVRSPASATNLVGLRPTTGFLSRGGIIPVTETQDTAGFLTRSVADIALLMEICSGFDPADPATAKQDDKASTDYTSFLNVNGLAQKRLGLLTNNLGNDPEVRDKLTAALETIKEQGAEIIELNIPEFEVGLVGENCDVQLYEFKEKLNGYLASATNCPVQNFDQLVDSGKLYPIIAGFMAECATIDDPQSLTEYKDKLLNIAKNRDLAYYIMAQHQLDGFVYPHQKILVQAIGLNTQEGRNGMLASTLGFPAITVPMGFSTPTAEAPIGVPMGIEFMARPWAEATLLEIATGFEQNTRARRLPPFTPAK